MYTPSKYILYNIYYLLYIHINKANDKGLTYVSAYESMSHALWQLNMPNWLGTCCPSFIIRSSMVSNFRRGGKEIMFQYTSNESALSPWEAAKIAFEFLCHHVDEKSVLLLSTTVKQLHERHYFKVTFKFSLLCKD